MSRFCSKCGAELKSGENFCSSCGQKVDEVPANIDLNSSGGFKEDYEIADILLKTTGRLNRLRYFKRSMAVALIEMVIVGLAFMLFTNSFGELSGFGSVVVAAILIAGQVIYYCLNVRRLHDLDKDETLAYVLLGLGLISALSSSDVFSMSAFETLSYCVECLGALYLLFAPGTHGDNKYGSDPLN